MPIEYAVSKMHEYNFCVFGKFVYLHQGIPSERCRVIRQRSLLNLICSAS